ncbi:MAG TPA: four helix bundle protein [Candidatus Acidoferrum sp.]|nr:four helix bundle protein [Candidatus Acidoferrum sp.]
MAKSRMLLRNRDMYAPLKVRSHKDLIVWQKSMQLAVMVFELSSKFPSAQTYGLTAQVGKSAASVPANMAEGHARASRKEYLHLVAIARGSLMETETFLMLAARLNYVTREEARPALELITEISKMLAVLRKRLKD